MGVFGRLLKRNKEEDDVLRKMSKEWPHSRAPSTITDEEKEAQKVAAEHWSIGMRQLSNHSTWKLSKAKGSVKVYKGVCQKMQRKVFKVEVSLDMPWKMVYELLMKSEDYAKWNRHLERCEVVAKLPPPEGAPRFLSFILYMRTTHESSKFTSRRDFCTAYQVELQSKRAVWVGTACASSLCPKFSRYVRGEQAIVVIEVKKVEQNSCLVTQIGAINFKGSIIPQALVDANMCKSLFQYGEDLFTYVDSKLPLK